MAIEGGGVRHSGSGHGRVGAQHEGVAYQAWPLGGGCIRAVRWFGAQSGHVDGIRVFELARARVCVQ